PGARRDRRFASEGRDEAAGDSPESHARAKAPNAEPFRLGGSDQDDALPPGPVRPRPGESRKFASSDYQPPTGMVETSIGPHPPTGMTPPQTTPSCSSSSSTTEASTWEDGTAA